MLKSLLRNQRQVHPGKSGGRFSMTQGHVRGIIGTG
jgi:hypothetical protein